jgi:hypothetical protein
MEIGFVSTYSRKHKLYKYEGPQLTTQQKYKERHNSETPGQVPEVTGLNLAPWRQPVV